MTEDTRKVGIQVTGDATPVKQAFSDVKDAGRDMAQSVAQSSQTAGKAIEGIGASADKLTQTQQRVVESIKRTAIGTTEGKAALLEYKAAVAGVADAAAPYIAKIKQAEQGQQDLGLSAKQMSFALRGIPAQFTDIAVSLQSGQRPLTVLLQQGGQLKDMFGGIGPAARAMGGYVLGLVTPLSVGAAALGAIGYAAMQGAKELDEFNKATLLTGNGAGLSASQFTALRDSLSGIAGTKGKAAEVLTEIAGNGRIAAVNVRAVAEAAALMERATGQAVSKTIEQFAELAKSPAEASAKLNEQYNFLTAAVYKQIKALEDQGRATDAAKLAESAYAEAIKVRAQSVIDSAGLMERAWHGITGAAKGAWDAMLGVGRELSPAEKLAAASANVARIQAQLAGVGSFAENAGGAAFGGASASRRAALQAQLDAAKQEQAAALRTLEIEQRNADAKAEQNRLAQLGIEFTKKKDEFLTKQEQRERELVKYQTMGQELVAAGIIKQTELTQVLNGIRQKYNETTGQSEVAQIKAKILIAQQYNDLLRKQINGDIPLDQSIKPTEAEQRVIALKNELAGSIMGVARARKQEALADAENLVFQEKETVVLEQRKALYKDAKESYDKQVASTRQSAEAIRLQALEQERANATFGKSKTAIEEARLAEMERQKAEREGSDVGGFVNAMDEKIKWQKLWIEQLRVTEAQQIRLKLVESGRSANEEAQSLALEVSLLGQSKAVRDTIIAQRRVEVALAKQLAEIDRSGASNKDELKEQARANAVVQAQNAAQRAILDEWQRTTDEINRSLTDALLRGFESGKGFAQNFRDTLKNMFATLVLRPVISAALSPVAGVMGGFTQSITGGSGVLGAANTASGAYNTYNMGSKAAEWLGLTNGIGSASASAAAGAAELYSSTAAYSTAYESLVAAGADTASAAAMATEATTSLATTATGINAALSAIPGWGWAAMAAIAIIGLSGSKGGPKQDGVYGTINSGIGRGVRTLDPTAQSTAQALQSQYDAMAKQFGATAAVSFGVGISTDPQGKSPTFLDFTGSRGGQTLFTSLQRDIDRSQEGLTAAISKATTEALFAGMKNSGLSKPFADFFAGVADSASTAQKAAALKMAQDVATYSTQVQDLGGVFSRLTDVSVAARAALIGAAGGLEALGQTTASYYQNFYSQREQRQITAQQIARTLSAAGIGISTEQVLSSSREQFRALVDSLDVTTEAGQRAFSALMSVSGAFASITQQADAVSIAMSALQRAVSAEKASVQATLTAAQEQRDAAKSVSDTIQSALRDLYGQANGAQQAARGRSFIDQALATAKGTGYLPDATQLANAIAAATAGINGAVYASEFDRKREQLVLAGKLSDLEEIAGPQLDVAQMSLDAARKQLDALDAIIVTSQMQVDAANGIDTSVVSVREAIYRLSLALGVTPDRPTPVPRVAGFGIANQIPMVRWATGDLQLSTVMGLGLPKFDVGANRLPSDMLAMVHKDEAIIPARFNPWAGGAMGDSQRLEQQIERLTEEVKVLRGYIADSATHQRRTADALEGRGAPIVVDLGANSGKVKTT